MISSFSTRAGSDVLANLEGKSFDLTDRACASGLDEVVGGLSGFFLEFSANGVIGFLNEGRLSMIPLRVSDSNRALEFGEASLGEATSFGMRFS